MGSIPFGYILTKIFLKKDIREIGSGNIGATNALRTGNKPIGYLTLTLDVLKAVIPVLFIKINYPDLIHVSALSLFIGHVFPIWMKFKGGKGVATYVGILFCLNLNLGILFIFSWLIISLISEYSFDFVANNFLSMLSEDSSLSRLLCLKINSSIFFTGIIIFYFCFLDFFFN